MSLEKEFLIEDEMGICTFEAALIQQVHTILPAYHLYRLCMYCKRKERQSIELEFPSNRVSISEWKKVTTGPVINGEHDDAEEKPTT